MAIMTKEVQAKFDTYPAHVQAQMFELRELILKLAEAEGIVPIKETLKWGEPSYLTPKGSTIRFDWKAKSPDSFSVYFICSTRLVETFKEVYSEELVFDSNRAIVFRNIKINGAV